MTWLFAELRSRLTLVAIALLLPTCVFWAALVLQQVLGVPAPFDAIFGQLDRSLGGKLLTAVMVLAMPAFAALCAALELWRRRRRGEVLVWLNPMILALGSLSAAGLLYHVLTDR